MRLVESNKNWIGWFIKFGLNLFFFNIIQVSVKWGLLALWEWDLMEFLRIREESYSVQKCLHFLLVVLWMMMEVTHVRRTVPAFQVYLSIEMLKGSNGGIGSGHGAGGGSRVKYFIPSCPYFPICLSLSESRACFPRGHPGSRGREQVLLQLFCDSRRRPWGSAWWRHPERPSSDTYARHSHWCENETRKRGMRMTCELT